MTEWSVPLAQPRLREHELAEAIDAYRSGWLAMGPRTQALEHDVASYTGAREAVALSSCTAALHLACLGSDLGAGDSVVVPSLTFAATVNAIAQVGAQPRFADIKSLTEPWPGAKEVEDAADSRTRAVMTMAYGGHLGETEAIAAAVAEQDRVLIEDAAHASGSWSGGRHAGTFGLAGCLSFSASKNLGIGEGGMLLTADETLARRVRRLRWQGISSDTWARHGEAAPEYELGEVGFNYRIDDPRAALAAALLRRLDDDNRKRAGIDAAYRNAFDDEDRLEPTAAPPAGERSSHCLFTVVLDEGIDRTAFRSHLSDRGVQTSVHFPPAHATGAHAGTGVRLPLTEAYARRSVSLPIFPHMEEWQTELVVSASREALDRSARAAA